MTNYLDNKINEVFENIVNPSLNKIVKEYDGVNGYKASIVSNCPVIMGIGRYKSIQITHPNNLVHIICIYWIEGEDKIIAENIRHFTLQKIFNIYDLNKKEFKKNILRLAAVTDNI